MKCIEVKENLDAFADGEIDFPEQEKIESHLKTCASCQTELEALQTISRSIKQTLPIVAPTFLDAKVMSAFQDHHAEKQIVEHKEKVGWFGIPKLAFATAFLLLALFSGFAFQLGRMSVEGVANLTSEKTENNQKPVNVNSFAKKDSDKNVEKIVETKIVEVPIIKEKIVKVPIIKEKIITRTVYVDKTRGETIDVSKKNNLALNSSIKDGEFLTQTNLKDFQPVSEIKPKVSKKE